MAQVEWKTEDRARGLEQRARASHRAGVLLTGICLLSIAGLCGRQNFALSQQAPSSLPGVQVKSGTIVAHLNSVIQFYRSSTQPTIQKAGEPNDVVYRDQAAALSAQVAQFAFQSAKAEAALTAAGPGAAGAQGAATSTEQQQKMQALAGNVERQIGDLEAREVAAKKQIATAKQANVPALQAQEKQIEGALGLANAMNDALKKIVGMSEQEGSAGLAGDIDRLEGSVPELQGKNKTAAPQLITLESAQSSGVTSQGTVLFYLIETRQALDALVHENDDLNKQVVNLRAPLSSELRNLIQQGQELTQQAAEPIAAAPVGGAKGGATGKGAANAAVAPTGQPDIESITTTFKALSAATVPLSQEMIVLAQSRANLTAWQSSATREYKTIFHSLLLRVLVIAVALVLIVGGGEVWTHATNKYVRDIRRRRQFLIVRRIVVGFLSAIVVLFGFVTQFNSLATFAGFITAGIAVGLQTILLSVAAYFFIIGRYGVKVGDRITISSVTGDVIEVGLVRFYMMELAGSSTELHPTGRIAVFSNAVLFQAGTPLYKQMPGTEYAWHELILKLTDTANYKSVCEAVLKEVRGVYESYRAEIEHQHRGVENWMQASIDPPAVESRLQFGAGTFQLWTRFPVQIARAAETDEKLTQALVEMLGKNPEIKSSLASSPVIQASVRG
jgi:small-conductance mechanosensitive channel